MRSTIEVQGAAITIHFQKEQDFICLTDIARSKSVDRFDDLVRNPAYMCCRPRALTRRLPALDYLASTQLRNVGSA